MSTPQKKKLLLSAAVPAAPVVRVKIVDVAREAGVSLTTVSHALNDRGFVDPKTREAVKLVALRLGYRPNRHAQRLRTAGAHMIILVSSMPFAVAGGPSRLGFLMEIAAVAAGAALSRGLALVLAPPAETGALSLESLDIDGAIVLEPTAADSQVAYFLQQGLPVVSIGKPALSTDALPFVDLNSSGTTRQLLEHLHTAGARNIALLIGQQQRTSYLEAVAAYQAFAKDCQMRPVLKKADERGGEQGGRLATLELLAREPHIDAICAPIDAFAVGAVLALNDLGRRVPDDVMVATRYDGLRARHCSPPLTSLNLHLDVVATQAVALLLDHLRGDTSIREVHGPTAELIIRQSSQRTDLAPALQIT